MMADIFENPSDNPWMLLEVTFKILPTSIYVGRGGAW
jgi:hypothetical protein